MVFYFNSEQKHQIINVHQSAQTGSKSNDVITLSTTYRDRIKKKRCAACYWSPAHWLATSFCVTTSLYLGVVSAQTFVLHRMVKGANATILLSCVIGLALSSLIGYVGSRSLPFCGCYDTRSGLVR